MEQEPVSLRLENPRMVMQALRAAKAREQAGRLARTLRVLVAPAQKKLPVRVALTKNNVRPPQSQRASAALGKEDRFVRQAFPPGGTLLPA